MGFVFSNVTRVLKMLHIPGLIHDLKIHIQCEWTLRHRNLYISVWGRVLLEKLIFTYLVTKHPAFHRTIRFIIVFTRVRHWCLSWAKWIQSILFHPISLKFILILIFPSTSRSCKWSLLNQVFQPNYCTRFSSLQCVLHAPPISSSMTWSP